jgi:hypothetical protein
MSVLDPHSADRRSMSARRIFDLAQMDSDLYQLLNSKHAGMGLRSWI